MGKIFKESYANTYAARNVRNALEKLINVLQSPQEKRSLSVRTGAAAAAAARERDSTASTIAHTHDSSPSRPATAATAATSAGPQNLHANPRFAACSAIDHDRAMSYHGSSASVDGSDSYYGGSDVAGRSSYTSSSRKLDGNKSSREATPPLIANHLFRQKRSSSGGSQSSQFSENCDFVNHIPPLLHDQIWKRSLRGPPVGCKPRPKSSHQRNKFGSPEADWSSAPCKSWTSPLGGIYPSRPF